MKRADVLTDPEVQRHTQRIMSLLSDELAGIRKRKGSLTGTSKQKVLAAIERLRAVVLKWPAWATPVTGKPKTR